MSKTINTDNLNQQIGLLEEELVVLREELEVAKKTIALQQECLFKGYRVEEFVKCLLCGKIFTNNSYLAAHNRRRHTAEEGERAASKETQTDFFYPDLDIKRSESFNDKEEEYQPQSPTSSQSLSLSVKHRKTKNSFKSNFSSIGKKLNKILKKK